MSNTELAAVKPRSLAKGLMAGLVAGLAGTVAMALAERLLPARASAKSESRPEVSNKIRWGFGATAGAAYGAVAEFYPAATAKAGVSFGMTLGALSEEGVIPALGLLVRPAAPGSASEITAHVVYGVTTEMVRGFVRKRL